jgi:hypothetical protein
LRERFWRKREALVEGGGFGRGAWRKEEAGVWREAGEERTSVGASAMARGETPGEGRFHTAMEALRTRREPERDDEPRFRRIAGDFARKREIGAEGLSPMAVNRSPWP